MINATITNVQVGHLTIEGLLADDGKFYVAVPQISERFSFLIKNASRDLKALRGGSFPFLKLKTKLNSKAVNAIPLSDFEAIVVELAIKGNPIAQRMTRDLVGLSLNQLFCDAFGLKFEAEDRQQWLRERQAHRDSFQPHLTKWLKADAGGNSKAVGWGKEVNDFKRACKLPLIPVEQYDGDALSKLNRAEASYDAMRQIGANHLKALQVLSSR